MKTFTRLLVYSFIALIAVCVIHDHFFGHCINKYFQNIAENDIVSIRYGYFIYKEVPNKSHTTQREEKTSIIEDSQFRNRIIECIQEVPSEYDNYWLLKNISITDHACVPSKFLYIDAKSEINNIKIDCNHADSGDFYFLKYPGRLKSSQFDSKKLGEIIMEIEALYNVP